MTQKLRVVFRPQTVRDTGNEAITYIDGTRLGFVTLYEPKTKAYAKRAATQDAWANVQDGVAHSYRRNLAAMRSEYTALPDHLQPVIIDNIPMAGFKILHGVARERGNKLWRILHPANFEFEITSGNLEHLISTGTLVNGEFIGAMVFTTSKNLGWA